MQRLKRLEVRLRRLRNRAAPLLYAGNALHCPACERSFRKFRTAGRERRRNAVCPGCAARERDRLASLFLRDLAPTTRILHIAPEACLAARLRELAGGGYVSADLMRTDVHERLDMLALPHRDGTFGGVYCSHVLQDVRDDGRAMAEVFRSDARRLGDSQRADSWREDQGSPGRAAAHARCRRSATAGTPANLRAGLPRAYGSGGVSRSCRGLSGYGGRG